MLHRIFTTLLLFTYSFSDGQRIDSLPFNLNKGLLTVKGFINESEVEFIMDTGAGMTVTTNAINESTSVKTMTKKVMVRDANNETQKLRKVKIRQIKLGSFSVADLQAVTFDMPYMDCHQLVLLGQDFMQKFNWKFDFERQMAYLSDIPFLPSEVMVKWDINFVKNRPFIEFELGNKKSKSLIDLGYRGYFDINASFGIIDSVFKVKQKEGEIIPYSAMVMGLTTTKTEQPIHYVLLDSLHFSKQPAYNIPVSLSTYTSAKIGIHFFTSFFSKLIINNSERTMYYQKKEKPDYAQPALDAGFSWEHGKLIVSDLNTGIASSAAKLKIGEEIKTIDGRTAADFGSYCSMIRWRFGFTQPDLWIEKMDGTKILIRRQSLLDFINR